MAGFHFLAKLGQCSTTVLRHESQSLPWAWFTGTLSSSFHSSSPNHGSYVRSMVECEQSLVGTTMRPD